MIEIHQEKTKEIWFKRKLYGWGWVPVTWHGWLVTLIGVAIGFLGIYVGETDDSPGAGGLGIILMLTIIFYFCYKKGQKPRWQWGKDLGDE